MTTDERNVKHSLAARPEMRRLPLLRAARTAAALDHLRPQFTRLYNPLSWRRWYRTSLPMAESSATPPRPNHDHHYHHRNHDEHEQHQHPRQCQQHQHPRQSRHPPIASLAQAASVTIKTLQHNRPTPIPAHAADSDDLSDALHVLPPHVPKKLWRQLEAHIRAAEARPGQAPDGADPHAEECVAGDRWMSIRCDGAGFKQLVGRLRAAGILPHGYSDDFGHVMRQCTLALMDQFHGRCGYTQSDELLVLVPPQNPRQVGRRAVPRAKEAATHTHQHHDHRHHHHHHHHLHQYRGRVSKISSLAASTVTARFNFELAALVAARGLPPLADPSLIGCFDCRVGSYETEEEALSMLLWRSYDCGVNGVSDAVYQMACAEEALAVASAPEEVLGNGGSHAAAERRAKGHDKDKEDAEDGAANSNSWYSAIFGYGHDYVDQQCRGVGGRNSVSSSSSNGSPAEVTEDNRQEDPTCASFRAADILPWATPAKLEWLTHQGLLPLPPHQAYGTLFAKVWRIEEGFNPKTGGTETYERFVTEVVPGPVLAHAATGHLLDPPHPEERRQRRQRRQRRRRRRSRKRTKNWHEEAAQEESA